MVPFVSLIYLYMLRLIKDVDNPFDYEDGRRGLESGEVALFPLDEYLGPPGCPARRLGGLALGQRPGPKFLTWCDAANFRRSSHDHVTD